MFIAYLDASGRPERTDPENLVLAAIVIKEQNYQYLDNEIKQIKLKHFPNLPDEKVEFHAKDMMNRTGIFKTLTWNKIFEIFDDVFDFVANPLTDITIIASLIEKPRLYPSVDAEKWAYKLVFERLNTFIGRKNSINIQMGLQYEYGIMITDSEGTTKDQKLRNKLIGMLRGGTDYSPLEYIIEDPLFTDSKWRNLSQLVDCVAYGIRKQHRVNNTESNFTAAWNAIYRKIETKFDRDSNGSYTNYGLKRFP
jgi:hypothetical protein